MFWSDEERHKKWRGDLLKSRRHIVALGLGDSDIRDLELINRIADRYSELKEEMLCVFPEA